ncbi:MAG TPA: alpha-E domain-containing protein [Solirubrobacteraceae bacterium]|nr:alpha-E domain-containing protein [Solirubrobacteraceae bacterium]
MLARIAHELYWLGRNLARAEFTARAVEAVFQSELQGNSETRPSVSFGAGGLGAMLGHGGGEPLMGLTLDGRQPGSMVASIERAREGARTVRDVISAEMWEAINTTTLKLREGEDVGWGAPAGPYLASQYLKQRTALIWGIANRSMLRDEAKCFLDAGGLIEISDMVLRMLRIALAPGRSGKEERSPADGYALILLQAVGGFPAYLRAVTAPPNAQPVARFLIFERAYPDSVAACVDSLHEAFTAADAGPRNSKPVLRVSRLAADLDFQRRALPDGAELTGICERTQEELARIDQDVAERYFAGAAPAGTGRPFAGGVAGGVARAAVVGARG